MSSVNLDDVRRRAERILATENATSRPIGADLEMLLGAACSLARQSLRLADEAAVLRPLVEGLENAVAVLDAERLAAVDASERWRDRALDGTFMGASE